MAGLRRKRLWSKGKEGVYQVSGETDEHSPLSCNSGNQKPPRDSKKQFALLKSKNKSYSLAPAETDADTDTDASKSQQIFRASSIYDTVFEMNGNGLHGSSDSLLDEGDDWSLLSADENAVRLLSSQKRGSIALDQILLDVSLDRKEDHAEKPREGEVDPDVKEIVAAITGRRNSESAESETDSDSGSSTAVSESSDVEDVSSSEESEIETQQEAFDVDAHVSKLLNDSESDSDSDLDGNASDTSEKAFQKAVRKVIRRMKRERSDGIVDSDEESEKSEKESGSEESASSDDDSASEVSDKEDDASDASSTKSPEESFEMERDIDLEIAELMKEGLVIDPKMGKHGDKDSRTVYKYYLTNSGRISTVKETVNNNDPSEATENPSGKAGPLLNRQKIDDNMASTLVDDKVQDLRWPFSNFYIKEFNQDQDEGLPDEEIQALPSYRSAAASASYPGRKRNVMLGRVWWVEWWAMEDSRMKNLSDESYSL